MKILRRKLAVQQLESRYCMDVAWQNDLLPMDVNQSGVVTPIDALVIINYLNRGNPATLPAIQPAEAFDYDCDGDGEVNSLDFQLIIDALNRYNSPLTVDLQLSSDNDLNGNGVVIVDEVTYVGTSLPNTDLAAYYVFSADHTLLLAESTSNEQGLFELLVPLTEGDNPLRIVATDPLGRTVETEMEIVKSNVVRDWNAAALDVVRAVNGEPPRVARNLAMIHTAMFDAINAIEPSYQSYLSDLVAPENVSSAAAAAAAAYTVAIALYPNSEELQIWNRTRSESLAVIPNGPAKDRGLQFGQAVGEAMLAARSNDGSAATVSYVSGNQPGDWQRTPPGFLPPMLPQWPTMTPFVVEDITDFRAPALPPLNSTEYAASLDEVMRLGSFDSTLRTEDQTEIAYFWADGAGTFTPPGHWNQIAAETSSSERLSLLDTARTMALLNLALADAGIASWDSKYFHDFWRPIDAIRNADVDGNPNTTADPNWTPLLTSPPFPTYTSGHSTFSGAGDAVLTTLFGDDFAFSTSMDPNAPLGSGSNRLAADIERSFSSFTAAANEAGMSRIYGGIHFDFDNTEGLTAGRAVGQSVVSSALRPL